MSDSVGGNTEVDGQQGASAAAAAAELSLEQSIMSSGSRLQQMTQGEVVQVTNEPLLSSAKS